MTNWQNDTSNIWRSTTHMFVHTLDPRTSIATTPSTSDGAGSAASWATRTPKTGPPSSSSGCFRWPPTSPSGASLSTWPSTRPLRTLWQKKTGGSICRSGQCPLMNRTNKLGVAWQRAGKVYQWQMLWLIGPIHELRGNWSEYSPWSLIL